MTKRIYIAGHKGMVGSALMRQLEKDTNNIIVTASFKDLDLRNQQQVADFFAQNPIDEVYFSAAKVGGIHANDTYPANFIYENLVMECNVIHQAWQSGVYIIIFRQLMHLPEAGQPAHAGIRTVKRQARAHQ